MIEPSVRLKCIGNLTKIKLTRVVIRRPTCTSLKVPVRNRTSISCICTLGEGIPPIARSELIDLFWYLP